jgi:dihydroxyacetone kinase
MRKGASLMFGVLGDRVNAATRPIGLALTSCTVPAAGKPTFDLAQAEMEVGVGIHGEPGRRRVKLQPANDIAAEIVGAKRLQPLGCVIARSLVGNFVTGSGDPGLAS